MERKELIQELAKNDLCFFDWPTIYNTDLKEVFWKEIKDQSGYLDEIIITKFDWEGKLRIAFAGKKYEINLFAWENEELEKLLTLQNNELPNGKYMVEMKHAVNEGSLGDFIYKWTEFASFENKILAKSFVENIPNEWVDWYGIQDWLIKIIK